MIQIERTTVIVDLENACGGAHMVPTLHKPVHQAVTCLVGVSPHLLIYSTGPKAIGLCPDVWFEWQGSGARFVQGRGLNGADNALIEVIKFEPVASRSSRLVLVSGDHAFAEPVAKLKAQGIRTTVVSRPGSLSRELQQQADQVCWLPEFSLAPLPPHTPNSLKDAA
jgi:hypothetical protein